MDIFNATENGWDGETPYHFVETNVKNLNGYKKPIWEFFLNSQREKLSREIDDSTACLGWDIKKTVTMFGGAFGMSSMTASCLFKDEKTVIIDYIEAARKETGVPDQENRFKLHMYLLGLDPEKFDSSAGVNKGVGDYFWPSEWVGYPKRPKFEEGNIKFKPNDDEMALLQKFYDYQITYDRLNDGSLSGDNRAKMKIMQTQPEEEWTISDDELLILVGVIKKNVEEQKVLTAETGQENKPLPDVENL